MSNEVSFPPSVNKTLLKIQSIKKFLFISKLGMNKYTFVFFTEKAGNLKKKTLIVKCILFFSLLFHPRAIDKIFIL